MDPASLKPFVYPEVLYCDECKRDVAVSVIDCRTSFAHRSGQTEVQYRAAACPVCGKVLCDRDQDRAIMAETVRIMEEENRGNDSDGDTHAAQ